MEDEPINQNYLIGCDTVEHSPSCMFVLQAKIADTAVIIRLSGPLKECYARDNGLDYQKMLSASDYKEK